MNRPPLSLEDAQARLLALAAPLPVEHVDPAGALGRYLAEPLLARRTQPACDLSAMDGYAVTEGDMAGPWRVVGESAAGHPFSGTLKSGEAVRISTGATMPAGAAAVILQEDLAREGDRLTLTGEAPAPPARHIRREGMDFRSGEPVLPAGALVGPAQIALAVASGHAHLPVRRRPRLAILDSGDELAADPGHCLPHQVPASNGVMLAALAASIPCVVQRLGPVPDNLEALADALERAQDADIVVTSGGASVGDHDLIRPALEAWGAEIDFWRVAIKPGKPILVAHRPRASGGRQLVLGLPGNPVSSHVTAYLFLLPLLRALLGAADSLPRAIPARLSTPLKPGGPRREFLRAVWNGSEIAVQRVQDSAALSSLAASNALLDRPANAPAAAQGDRVTAYLLHNGGIAGGAA